MSVTLTVNGQRRSFDGDPRTPLIDLLRGTLHLTGAKDVCREGFCGACTVMIDGQPVPACLRPVGMLDGAEVTTVEGLSAPDALNPVQQAFIDHDVVQCGMCFPGMVVTLSDLLKANTTPSRAEVKAALTGNLCRCTGYERIIDAVLSLSTTEEPPQRPAHEHPV